jgi:phage tail-like protein
MEHGTSTGRYLFEFDGIAAIRASEVSGLKKTHDEFELFESNRPNPRIGRGHFKCEPVSVKHGHALNETGDEFFLWMELFIKGDSIERRGGRLIELDEDGDTPVATWELFDCIPISIAQENNTGGGKDASYFTFVIRPEDLELL